jgi:beta-glucosidase-like glycosyl hydrolase
MAALHDEYDSETHEESGDDPSNVSQSFQQAFETMFADRLGSNMKHFPGEDQ